MVTFLWTHSQKPTETTAKSCELRTECRMLQANSWAELPRTPADTQPQSRPLPPAPEKQKSPSASQSREPPHYHVCSIPTCYLLLQQLHKRESCTTKTGSKLSSDTVWPTFSNCFYFSTLALLIDGLCHTEFSVNLQGAFISSKDKISAIRKWLQILHQLHLWCKQCHLLAPKRSGEISIRLKSNCCIWIWGSLM